MNLRNLGYALWSTCSNMRADSRPQSDLDACKFRKHSTLVLPVAPAVDCNGGHMGTGRAALRLVARWRLAYSEEGKPVLIRRWTTETSEKEIIELPQFRGGSSAVNSASA